MIIDERDLRGKFINLENFLERVPIGLDQVLILIRIDALRFTGKSKKALLWDAHLAMGNQKKKDPIRELFPVQKRAFTLPELEQTSLENTYDELEILGFSVTIPAFELLQTSFRGKKVRMLGNLVTVKNVRTKRKEWMNFGTFLDKEGEFFDVVNFPDSLRRYPYKGRGIYLLYGVITAEFGFPGMTVEKMARLPYKPDPRY